MSATSDDTEVFSFADLSVDDVEETEPEAVKAPRNSRNTGGPSAPARRGRRSSKNKLDTLQKKLSGEMFQAGAIIGMGLPVTGYYCCQESDSFTKAVVQLAARRSEWIDALEHIADVQPGIVIGRTAVGLGAAIAVDRGRADPEKKFMQFLGVWSAWSEVNSKRPNAEEGSAYKPPPSQFVPVA